MYLVAVEYIKGVGRIWMYLAAVEYIKGCLQK